MREHRPGRLSGPGGEDLDADCGPAARRRFRRAAPPPARLWRQALEAAFRCATCIGAGRGDRTPGPKRNDGLRVGLADGRVLPLRVANAALSRLQVNDGLRE
jgi:hypothetical protein